MTKNQSEEFKKYKGKIVEISKKYNKEQREKGLPTAQQKAVMKRKENKLLKIAIGEILNSIAISKKDQQPITDSKGNKMTNLDVIIKRLVFSSNENVIYNILKMYGELNGEFIQKQEITNIQPPKIEIVVDKDGQIK